MKYTEGPMFPAVYFKEEDGLILFGLRSAAVGLQTQHLNNSRQGFQKKISRDNARKRVKESSAEK